MNCLKCGTFISEVGCLGCRRKIKAYICPTCGAKNRNSHYRTPVACPECRETINSYRGNSRHKATKSYMCKHCLQKSGKVVNVINPDYGAEWLTEQTLLE